MCNFIDEQSCNYVYSAVHRSFVPFVLSFPRCRSKHPAARVQLHPRLLTWVRRSAHSIRSQLDWVVLFSCCTVIPSFVPLDFVSSDLIFCYFLLLFLSLAFFFGSNRTNLSHYHPALRFSVCGALVKEISLPFASNLFGHTFLGHHFIL